MTDEATDQPRRRKRKRQAEPKLIELTTERENRERLTLMRPSEEVTLGPTTRFVVIPAKFGKGWNLKVFFDPEEVE